MLLGLTGGIGSGKSQAGIFFEQQGICVVDADQCARVVVQPGRPALQQIAAHFGAEMLQPDGSLDRAAMRQLVFAQEEKRLWLEQLLHPLIAQEIATQLAADSGPYRLLMSPLLLETDQHKICERIILIDLPEPLQLQRAGARDANTPEQIRAIMDTQMNRSDRLAKADYVLDNSGSLEQLQLQVKQLHLKLLDTLPHTNES
ncbi:MAG: dephospho-CoA kinase [Gammaproteobacteria bacterium]